MVQGRDEDGLGWPGHGGSGEKWMSLTVLEVDWAGLHPGLGGEEGNHGRPTCFQHERFGR